MASYPQIEYDAADTELYKTNLYSGTDADLDNTDPVDATDGYTDDIDLTVNFEAVIDFKFDASGATDALILILFGRRDDAWDGDEIPLKTITVPNDGSEDIYRFVLSVFDWGAGHFRFAQKSEAANDTFDIDTEARFWRLKNSDT